MRILAIRGENLASLGQPFEIDFEAEPLASTGLFAITGETGSGKSTILDALCLALYGAYPRFFTQGQNDALPDPSGARARIADGSTILRRGAGSGYAEVDFLGQDNQRYRARWEARRARNKADGAIQNAARTLHHIHGDTHNAIATSKREVQDAIHAQTGLTFDQFCRTVLLAQGEFDSFLLAPERERGALLEKITGTEIYGRISRVVYEGTRQLKAEAEQLETNLTNLGLLTTADREALEQTIQTLHQDTTTKTAERTELQLQITALNNLLQAQQRLATAEQTLTIANQQAEAATADRTRLAALQSAEPLRPLRDQLTSALREQASAEHADRTAKQALQQASLATERAQESLTAASTAHAAAEEQFKHFSSIWDEASRLDAEVTAAQRETETANQVATRARTDLASADSELRTLAAEISETARALQTATTALAERSHLLPLADQLTSVESQVSLYITTSQTAHTLQQQEAEANRATTNLRAQTTALEAQLAHDNITLTQATTATASLQQQLEASDADQWQAEESALALLQRQANEAQQLTERHQAALTLQQHSHSEHEQATAAVRAASLQAETANATLLAQTSRREGLQRTSELAEESLDQRNAHLRSLLTEGESCPICGATEHPYTAPGHTDDALTRLAEDLRAQRAALDIAIADANRDLQDATLSRATAEGKASSTQRDEANATRDLATIAASFLHLHEAMSPSCARFDLTQHLPETLSGTAAAQLTGLRASVAQRHTLATQHLASLRNLRSQLDANIKAQQTAQAAVNASNRKLSDTTSALHAAELQATTTSQQAQQATARLTEIETDLLPVLTAAHVSADALRTNATNVLTNLRNLAAEVTHLRTRTHELTAATTELEGTHKQKLADQQHAAITAQQAETTLQQRSTHQHDLTAARALLLDGEPTAQHRSRINNARLQSQTEHTNAQSGEGLARAALAEARTREDAATQALNLLLTEIANARTAYIDACATIGILPTHADELLQTSTAETTTLKSRLDTLDRAVRDAQVTVADRHNDLAPLLASGADPAYLPELTASAKTLTEQINAALEESGRHKRDLQRDNDLRLTAADLRRQSDEKAATLAIWQQVEDAIGSANGDRFRTFAQSLTLDQLIVLANDHLDSFSKRYRLARSLDADLALHVIDVDMGDEERAIRSLSGGERFLVSLALALSLSGLEGRDFSVDTLFIDEGFGALDADTLDVAITALETLHSRGRKVGVITHVAAMIESIPVQLRVEKLGGGSSVIRLQPAL